MKPKIPAPAPITSDEWMAELDRIRQESELAPTPDVPAHAFTICQYAARYEIPITTALGQIRRMVQAKKLRQGLKYMPDARGHMVLTKCFWPNK